MYYALRCTYHDTAPTLEWVKNAVGGPDDEFHVSCPGYPREHRSRRDKIELRMRFALPGLIFVKDWTYPLLNDIRSSCPDRYLRWLVAPGGSLMEFSPLEVLELEEAALYRSTTPASPHGGLVAAESVRISGLSPLNQYSGEVVSEHHQGFVEPYYMVRMHDARITLKVDGFLLERD